MEGIDNETLINRFKEAVAFDSATGLIIISQCLRPMILEKRWDDIDLLLHDMTESDAGIGILFHTAYQLKQFKGELTMFNVLKEHTIDKFKAEHNTDRTPELFKEL